MEFKIIGGNKNAQYSIKEIKKDGILDLHISLSMKEAEIPEKFSVEWLFEGEKASSLWNPRDTWHGLGTDWGMHQFNSRLASGMPIQQIVSFDSKNVLTIAVSDVDTPTKIATGFREEDALISCRVEFFTVPTNKKKEYSVTVRLDTRDLPFYDSIYDTVDWWENDCGYKSAYVPDTARQPMDSLWYSFHQQLDHDKILEECKRSSKLGMKTVIIDDGWQTDDNNRGYAYCGDWEVCEKKMGDMKTLVDKIHDIGMSVILWYSVPFVGMYSKKYDEFKDYFLDGAGNAGTSFSLDPRYKKCRDYLVNIYKDAVTNWGLDGLKLDFIDSFLLQGKSLEDDPMRDFQSLEDALHALMSEIKEELTKINPDIMIEFRQSYVGPSIRKYGNMLRVGDCPGCIMANRTQIINLRLTSGKTAVHSDMIMWNENDTVENASLQFASVIFSVPQISMLIDNLPESHIKMLEHYISFWKNKREVLIDGKLIALNPETNYSQARSQNEKEEVVAVYTNPVVDINRDICTVVNASSLMSIILKSDKTFAYKTVNCMGETTDEGKCEALVSELNVPQGGMVFIER